MPTPKVSDTPPTGSGRRGVRHFLAAVLVGVLIGPWSAQAALAAKTPEREPVTMSVVAVNPSADRTQVVPVKIELPQEITPKDILDSGELQLEYDEDRQAYYVYKESVALAPRETRVFEVSVRDVWFIPKNELNALRDYTSLVMERLQKTSYAATAKALADNILKRLNAIDATQNDDSLSRKSRIGAYRHHLQAIAAIKEDLARMEKLLTFVGGPPVPEMLEESPLKSDAFMRLSPIEAGSIDSCYETGRGAWRRLVASTVDQTVGAFVCQGSALRSLGRVTANSAPPS